MELSRVFVLPIMNSPEVDLDDVKYKPNKLFYIDQ